MSPSAFSRFFSRACGSTFSAWLAHIRTTQAARLLDSDNLSIDDVAYKVGFGSVRTLQRHFKDRYGLAPSEYRIRCRPSYRSNTS
jgi:AraC family transcriptional activator FtrA